MSSPPEQSVRLALQLLAERRFSAIIRQLSESGLSTADALEAAWPLLTRRLRVDGVLLIAAGNGCYQTVCQVLRRTADEAEAVAFQWTLESSANILDRTAACEGLPSTLIANVVCVATSMGRSPLRAEQVMYLLDQDECVRRLRFACTYVESANLIG
ncbi:hypothetical protein [Variovorax davisae]|uniref:hypothetical protein n=1 Tax=Variovorax davisae TaxID=3053515 RepID=UPI00336534E9